MLEMALSGGFLSAKSEKLDLSKACAKQGTGTVDSESGHNPPPALQNRSIAPCDCSWWDDKMGNAIATTIREASMRHRDFDNLVRPASSHICYAVAAPLRAIC
jgi:hypothetical protein